MRKILFFASLTFLLVSCGPSAQEKAMIQKRHDDSVAQVAAQIQHQKEVAAAQLQHQKEVAATYLKTYKRDLEMKVADLNAANDKMRDIQGFHLMRTSDEREAEIKQQTLVIEQLRDSINDLQSKITNLNTQLN